MRPTRLSDFVGQETAVGERSPLRRMIEKDQLQSVLFYGPPGTGKTTLAQVIAHMTGDEFVAINAVSSGVPELRKLIAKAQELQRGGMGRTIVFIDEIGAIGKKREGNISGNDEREQTLNQLLTEMDGFEENSGVIILAATNRPESLDPALTRPGRFDRRVPVELPDLKGREDILKVHAKKVKIAGDVDFEKGGSHGLRRVRRGAGQHCQRGRSAGSAGRAEVRDPGRPGREH